MKMELDEWNQKKKNKKWGKNVRVYVCVCVQV